MSYVRRVLVAADQLAFTLIGGMPDETLPAAAFRWELQGRRSWPRRIIDALFFFEPDHCYHAWRAEVDREQLPDFYRS